MTAQDLKNSILQLAMQGKLVPQDPNDEPASELLKRIKAEKVRLIKEGKIRKEKSQPAISKDEIPFDIPESWAWVRLGSAFSTVMGQSPEGSSVTEIEEGIEFHQGKIFFTDEIIAPSPQRTSKPTKIAPSGSILLCVRAPVGKVNITNRNICIGRGLAAIVTNGGILKKFTYYMLQTLETVFNQKANGSTFKAISSAIISNQVVPIPPISEQERIVEKIEELLPFIERYDESEKRLLELNKKFPDELRKSILQQAVQGKLTEQDPHDEPASELLKRIKAEKARLIKEGKIRKEKPLPPITDEEIPFDIPESWKWVRWGELAESIQYGFNAPAKSSGRIKMVRISDIQNNSVNWESVPYCDIEEENIGLYLLRSNDILFARTGGTVGKSFLVSDVPEEVIYAGYLIRTRYSPSLSPKFLKFFMESQLYWNQLRNGTIATAQPNCNGKTLGKMILPLPPVAEQARIVARAEDLLSVCDSLK